MPRLAECRGDVVAALLDRHGPPPRPGGGGGEAEGQGAGRFGAIARVAVGRVADPRTTEAVLAALGAAGLLDPEALGRASLAEVEDVLGGARVRLAAKQLGPLRRLAVWAAGGGLGDPGEEPPSTETLRSEWRAIGGIGPTTSDALLLFALGRTAYPVDRATYRILVRHGWLDPSADYDEARSIAEGLAPEDPTALAPIASAMARLGREHCQAGIPRCDRCPLRPWLPEGGPREAE